MGLGLAWQGRGETLEGCGRFSGHSGQVHTPDPQDGTRAHRVPAEPRLPRSRRSPHLPASSLAPAAPKPEIQTQPAGTLADSAGDSAHPCRSNLTCSPSADSSPNTAGIFIGVLRGRDRRGLGGALPTRMALAPPTALRGGRGVRNSKQLNPAALGEEGLYPG